MALQKQGYLCTEVDDPYDAMVTLCRKPLFYSAVIFSLNSLYREELLIISSIKRRFSHVDIWLSDTDGRQAALAEAMRLGADGLVADDGLHRVAAAPPATAVGFPSAKEIDSAPASTNPVPADQPADPSTPQENSADPLLTAEELRALLQETPGPSAG